MVLKFKMSGEKNDGFPKKFKSSKSTWEKIQNICHKNFLQKGTKLRFLFLIFSNKRNQGSLEKWLILEQDEPGASNKPESKGMLRKKGDDPQGQETQEPIEISPNVPKLEQQNKQSPIGS